MKLEDIQEQFTQALQSEGIKLTPQRQAVFSNIINSVTARAYTNYANNDFNTIARTGRVNQKSDQGKSRPDIVFPELSKPDKKYQDEKLEVKACSYNTNNCCKRSNFILIKFFN